MSSPSKTSLPKSSPAKKIIRSLSILKFDYQTKLPPELSKRANRKLTKNASSISTLRAKEILGCWHYLHDDIEQALAIWSEIKDFDLGREGEKELKFEEYVTLINALYYMVIHYKAEGDIERSRILSKTMRECIEEARHREYRAAWLAFVFKRDHNPNLSFYIADYPSIDEEQLDFAALLEVLSIGEAEIFNEVLHNNISTKLVVMKRDGRVEAFALLSREFFTYFSSTTYVIKLLKYIDPNQSSYRENDAQFEKLQYQELSAISERQSSKKVKNFRAIKINLEDSEEKLKRPANHVIKLDGSAETEAITNLLVYIMKTYDLAMLSSEKPVIESYLQCGFRDAGEFLYDNGKRIEWSHLLLF